MPRMYPSIFLPSKLSRVQFKRRIWLCLLSLSKGVIAKGFGRGEICAPYTEGVMKSLSVALRRRTDGALLVQILMDSALLWLKWSNSNCLGNKRTGLTVKWNRWHLFCWALVFSSLWNKRIYYMCIYILALVVTYGIQGKTHKLLF